MFVQSVARQEGNAQETKVEQIKQGNFALKASQQPGPLVSFGQNMVDKGDIQLFCYIDNLQGCDKEFVSVIPTILHGFKDNFSIYVQLPILAKMHQNDMTFHGVQDILMQLEWAFYDKTTIDTTHQMSIVGNVTLPTGGDASATFSPIAHGSFGAPTFFIGLTADYFNPRWYPFVSAGAKLTTTNQRSQAGNQFLYQCGLSRNICYKADGYIFNWMVEFDGIYKRRNITSGVIDVNSGGNQILLGPSLWFSTPHFSIQGGISWFVYQHLFGEQKKDTYYISIDVGYKF